MRATHIYHPHVIAHELNSYHLVVSSNHLIINRVDLFDHHHISIHLSGKVIITIQL